MAAELTLGAEEELHLIDLESWKLIARAPQLLSRLPAANYSAEIQRTTVETNTDVVSSLAGLRSELARLRHGLVQVAAEAKIGIASAGTAPSSAFADFELTTTGRYGRMQEQYRLLVDEQLICGLQIHVGVSDRDLAVEIMQRVARDLPVLLALSASSPYWNEQDTGYASIRSIIWQRWPSAGATGRLHSARAYDEMLADLINTGVIADAKMAYFDVRPSSHAPTLELRTCDACPLVDDAVLIAGLFRATVLAAEQEIHAGRWFEPVPPPVHRAAMWQAARGGLSGVLLDDTRHPKPLPATQAVKGLLNRLRPQLEELGDWAEIRELVKTALARGNSADRQRAAYAERGRLSDVVELVVNETHGPPGGPEPAVPALRRYRYRAGDEAVGPSNRPRPIYHDLIDFFRRLGERQLQERKQARVDWVDRAEMTFGVGGEKRRFSVDLMPRVISPHEWETLARGLIQRARAIETFLRDVYGEQRIVADGVLSRELLEGSPGWRAEATRLPAGTVRAPVMGFDLVRNEFGGWRVLEDNVRNPSGAAYAIAIRDLMNEVLPDLPRPEGLRDPAAALPLLRRCLLDHRAPDGTVALLSSGPAASEQLPLRMAHGHASTGRAPSWAARSRSDAAWIGAACLGGGVVGAAAVAGPGAIALAAMVALVFATYRWPYAMPVAVAVASAVYYGIYLRYRISLGAFPVSILNVLPLFLVAAACSLSYRERGRGVMAGRAAIPFALLASGFVLGSVVGMANGAELYQVLRVGSTELCV